jgi:hypothetical protein
MRKRNMKGFLTSLIDLKNYATHIDGARQKNRHSLSFLSFHNINDIWQIV